VRGPHRGWRTAHFSDERSSVKEYYGKRFFETDAELLDPRHTAFIVVDLQNDMVHPEGVFGPNPIERIVPSAAQLVDEAHSRGVLVT